MGLRVPSWELVEPCYLSCAFCADAGWFRQDPHCTAAVGAQNQLTICLTLVARAAINS